MKKIFWLSIAVLFVLFVLAAFSTVWGSANAQGTLPPVSTSIPAPAATPTPFSPQVVKIDPGEIRKVRDVCYLLQIDSRDWSGICREGVPESVVHQFFVVPVQRVAHREQLYYFRATFEVEFYDRSVYMKGEVPSFQVFFVLTEYERYMHDHQPEQFGVYRYNRETRIWEECTQTAFKEKEGPFGTFYCATNRTGIFALGYPVKRK